MSKSSFTREFAKALELWKPSVVPGIDPGFLELFQSGFFKHYQNFTEQVFFILDHATMKYLHVSENVEAVCGFSLEELLKDGFTNIQHRFHPDDVEKFGVISSLISEKLKTLEDSEILACRVTYDYRILFGDDKYHRILQHNIPITVDTKKNIGHVLIIASDISTYKTENNSGYKMIHYNPGSLPVTILEGIVGESSPHQISKREIEIIQLTADGLTEKQIADKLFLSQHTVKTHRKNLLRKTGAKNAVELVRYAAAYLVI